MDRGLQQLWEAGFILGGILFGFPLAVIIFRALMLFRCLPKLFPTTGGITCVESMARAGYCLFCCRNFAQTYVEVDNVIPQKKKEKMSCKKMFARCARRRKNQVEGTST